MTISLQRLSQGLLAAFMTVALAAGYWGFARRGELLSRDDNPRLILEERRIRRGQILDRNDIVLAESVVDVESGLTTRRYPHTEAAPVVGYYSLRHGVGGIEAEYDDFLRGNALLTSSERLTNRLLHRPQVGGDVQLTLDFNLQQAASRVLAEHKGAIVVMNVPQGEILAMVSHPTFDANVLDDTWDSLADDPDAPLVNRATQGLYQPGTILQSVILGAALDTGLLIPSETWIGDLAILVDSNELPCAGQTHGVDNVAAAFMWACPGPFQALGIQLGARQFDTALSDFGLLQAPTFVLPAEVADLSRPPAQANLSLTAVGQSDLMVSPLQMALVVSTLANHGQTPVPRLALSTCVPDGDWEPVDIESQPRRAISQIGADRVAELMAQAVSSGAAQAATLSHHTVYGHAGLALSGPEGMFNAWFIGFVYQTEEQAVVVAVLLEGTSEANVAARIGGQALQAALKTLP